MKILDLKDTGENIENLMVKNSISHKALSELIGVTIPATYSWTRGLKIPSIDNLILLSELFECSVDEILVTKKVEI